MKSFEQAKGTKKVSAHGASKKMGQSRPKGSANHHTQVASGPGGLPMRSYSVSDKGYTVSSPAGVMSHTRDLKSRP
jgi:hypothetical protein